MIDLAVKVTNLLCFNLEEALTNRESKRQCQHICHFERKGFQAVLTDCSFCSGTPYLCV